MIGSTTHEYAPVVFATLASHAGQIYVIFAGEVRVVIVYPRGMPSVGTASYKISMLSAHLSAFFFVVSVSDFAQSYVFAFLRAFSRISAVYTVGPRLDELETSSASHENSQPPVSFFAVTRTVPTPRDT